MLVSASSDLVVQEFCSYDNHSDPYYEPLLFKSASAAPFFEPHVHLMNRRPTLQEVNADFLVPDVCGSSCEDSNGSVRLMMPRDGAMLTPPSESDGSTILDQQSLHSMFGGELQVSEVRTYKMPEPPCKTVSTSARKTKRMLPINPPTSKARKTNGGGTGKSPVRAFVCKVPDCGKEFRDRSGLRKHTSAKHSFKCPHISCGKVLPTLENFLSHMHVHNGT